jgi:hypothetical protein
MTAVNFDVLSTEEIEIKMDAAISRLLEEDKFLLQNDLNERTITHRLAMYLQDLFPDWNVDCEYNRHHDKPKRLHFLVGNTQRDDTQASTVFPDIIVHHRNTDENLLVVEIKKSTNPLPMDDDLAKLIAFREELYYRYALFIRITTGQDNVGVKDLFWI